MRIREKEVLLFAFITIITLLSLTHLGFAKKVPSVLFTTQTPFFSPNKDGIQDEATFQIGVENIKSVAVWEIQLIDSSGAVRKTISDSKDLPSSISWNGQDEFGAPCSEGFYQVTAKVWNKKNQMFSASPLQVAIDLTSPIVSLTSSPDSLIFEGNALSSVPFNFSAVDLSGTARWKLQVFDKNKQEFFSESSVNPLPSSWILTNQKVVMPLGDLTAILSVIDSAGNEGKSIPVIVKAVEETEKVDEEVYESEDSTPPKQTHSGPFLQSTTILFVSDLFGKNAGRQSKLSTQASILLDPLAAAMIHSPGSKMMIFGHMESRKKIQETKWLSSYFAWKVYGYFVKQKGIDRSLISVKGLGSTTTTNKNWNSEEELKKRRVEIQIFFPLPSSK